MTLQMTTTKPNYHSTQITLTGKLNTDTAPAFDNEVKKALMDGSNMIVLDMAALELITSAGVGAVMKAQTTLMQKNGELMMINMQPQIKKVFEIVRLLPTLRVFESTQEMDHYLLTIQKRIQEDDSFESAEEL
jgi:anti-anti-sigma factor